MHAKNIFLDLKECGQYDKWCISTILYLINNLILMEWPIADKNIQLKILINI